MREDVEQEELELLYSKAKVFVAPQHMTRPSGIATKVFNALSRGIPVVTTSLSDVGLPPSSARQRPVRVARGAFGFASHVLELLINVSAWEAQQAAGSRFLDSQGIEHAQLSALRLALNFSDDVSSQTRSSGDKDLHVPRLMKPLPTRTKTAHQI